METKPILVTPLRGVDQRWRASAPTAAHVRDMWWDSRGAWSSAGGYKRIIEGPTNQSGQIVNPFETVGAIESIHYFSQHNGARRWIVYIDGSGNLYTFNPSTAARSGLPGDVAKDRANNTITRTTVSTPWLRSQSACWGDNFYLVNGIDRPVVFNGTWWDYAGWQAAAGKPYATAMKSPHAIDSGTPPIALPNTGLGPYDASGTDDYKVAYSYRVSYVNSRGAESPLSEPSETIYATNTGSSSGAVLVRLTLPIGPPEAVARRIYRTQNLYDSSNTLVTGRNAQYFYHSEINDNVTATIVDAKPDAFLGSLVDDTQMGTWPQNAKVITSFNGRMYALVDGQVRYSKRGNPEQWPVDNVIEIGDAHLGPGTALYATRNVLVVSKTQGIYFITDDGVNEPQCQTLTRSMGWIAHNTVREVPGVGLCGLSESGITVLQGTLQNEGVPTQVLNFAVPLPEAVRDLNRSALLNACAAVYHRDKEYWLCVPTGASPNNNRVWVFHYEIGEWSYRDNYPIASILETQDHAGNLLFGSYADTEAVSPDGRIHRGIMVYSRGCQYKDDYATTPTAIEPMYETNQISVASQFRSFRPKHVLVEAIGHGNNKLTLNLSSNGSLTDWLDKAATVIQQYPQELLPVYGTARFDRTDTWQDWHPITVRFDVDVPKRQPVFRSSIIIKPESGTRFMTLFGLSLEIASDDPQQVKPLLPDKGVS